jgi:hypothetical protein
MLFKKRKSRPTAGEAARRLLALKYVTVDAHAATPAEVLDTFEPNWTEIERREFAQKERAQRDRYWVQVRECGVWRQSSRAGFRSSNEKTGWSERGMHQALFGKA